MLHPLVQRRDGELREAYGFGLPTAFPAYEAASHGPWRVSPRLGGISQGYVAESTVEPPFHVLGRDGETWMSTAFLELESHAWHLHRARGLVVVAGLGMGMYACAAAAKADVQRVVVADIDGDVIALFRKAARIAPGIARKILIVHGDAQGPDLWGMLDGRRPDYLFADVWPTYPDPDAPAWTRALVETLRPREAGWWGQEAAFAHHCADEGADIDAATLSAFLAGNGMPSHVSEGYADFCRDVAHAHGLSPEPRRP